jgi:hypothetical protein
MYKQQSEQGGGMGRGLFPMGKFLVPDPNEKYNMPPEPTLAPPPAIPPPQQPAMWQPGDPLPQSVMRPPDLSNLMPQGGMPQEGAKPMGPIGRQPQRPTFGALNGLLG